MLVLLYIAVFVYLLFLKRKTKFTWLIVAALISFLSITSNFYADLDNYIPLFNYYNLNSVNINFSTTNFLWAYLCKLFFALGFNYRGMVVCLIFVNCFLLNKSAKNLGCNVNVFFAFFLIFPAIIQLVQLKFFTATSLVILAYSILVKDDKFSIIKFLLLIFLAFLIHNSTIVFILLLLIKFKKINKKAVFIFSFVLFLVLVFTIKSNFIFKIAKYFISDSQYNRYIVNSITPSSLIWLLSIFISWICCYFLCIFIMKTNNLNSDNKKLFEKNTMSITILLLTLPLLLIDRNMHRFLEVGYVIVYSMIGILFSDKIITRNKLMSLFLAIIILSYNMYIYTPFENVLKPIFSYDGIVNIRR